jgi:hypothetical protein
MFPLGLTAFGDKANNCKLAVQIHEADFKIRGESCSPSIANCFPYFAAP